MYNNEKMTNHDPFMNDDENFPPSLNNFKIPQLREGNSQNFGILGYLCKFNQMAISNCLEEKMTNSNSSFEN